MTKEPSSNGGITQGDDLILNEIFTLSPDKYFAFSWIEIFNPTNRSIPWFPQSRPATMLAVGANGTMLRTEDDGAHWANIPTNVTAGLNAISFPLPDTGYAVGENGAFIKVKKDSLNNFFFEDLSSTLNQPTISMYDMYAAPFPAKVIVVCGDSGVVIRSVDRGTTWQKRQNTKTTKKIHSIAYNTTTIYVAGNGGTILKQLAYPNWVVLTPPPNQTSSDYYAIKFVTEINGWAIGSGGAIAHTTNGETWKEQRSGVKADLRTGFFKPQAGSPWREGTGWVVGDSGVILYTGDYGETWVRQNSGTLTNLINLNFADSLHGWVFGEGGLILATSNGGSTWNQQQSRTTSNLLGSYMFPLDIFVVNYYELEMWGQRRYFFFDSATFTVNYDYITKIDTGLIHFIVGATEEHPIPPNGFHIVNSDSGKFKDHINLGPGSVRVSNYPIGFKNIKITGDDPFGRIIVPENAILWRLLSSGEIRLVKKYIKLKLVAGRVRVLDSYSGVIDLVRYGDFETKADYFPGEDTYPNNVSVTAIPDWYSLARWDNDRLVDINTASTAKSWYFAERPIPGWYSQKRK